MALSFQELTHENLSLYAQSLEHSELIFPDPIKFSREDYFEILYGQDNIAKVMLFDGSYAGNIVGAELHPVEIDEFNLHETCARERVIYLYGMVIEPEYQGRGYGMKLLMEFISAARTQGYTRLVGHFRANASLALMRKLGAAELSLERNWCESGEEYVFCSLPLAVDAVCA
jgi:GNAT superfamily N-acetyltransferase